MTKLEELREQIKPLREVLDAAQLDEKKKLRAWCAVMDQITKEENMIIAREEVRKEQNL